VLLCQNLHQWKARVEESLVVASDEGLVGLEVSDVFEAFCSDASDAIGTFVDAVFLGEDEFSFLCTFAEKDLAMHVFGVLDTCKVQGGWGKVDCAYEVVDGGAGFYSAGPTNDQRDVNSAVVEGCLVSEVWSAIIAEEDDDGVVGQAVIGEAIEDEGDFLVEDLDAFEIIGPVAACEWVFGVGWGQGDVVGVDGVLRVSEENAVSLGKVDLCKERLAGFSLSPVGAVEGFVDGEIEILFSAFLPLQGFATGGEISCVAEVFGD
jgi:hypothetical protein